MKIHKDQTLQFFPIFMTPSTWKSTKIRRFNFFQFSWPRVHENPQKSDASIFFNFHDPRVHENPQKSDALIFFNFHDPKSAKGRHQNFIPKLPDLYQAKIKPKISSLILTVKASNFEYCLFSRNNFRADLSICISKAVIPFCATKEPGCAIKGA